MELRPVNVDQKAAVRNRFSLTNLIAGMTVALVALPLAIAFGESAGLGAQAGITTAVLAGFIAAAFGGSRFQVSGPTGAMTVVLIPIVASHGVAGVLLTGLMAGLLLVIAGLAKLGRHIHRLPISVIEGFTAGIALVIGLQQVGWALGVNVPHADRIYQTAWEQWRAFTAMPDLAAPLLALLSAGAVFWLNHRLPKIPASIVVLLVATVVSQLFGLSLATVPKLAAPIGSFDLAWLSASADWLQLAIPALAVAALGGIEALLSAKVADNLRADGTQHDSDRELVGQGLANLVVPFFGGVPATAALARTAVNVRSGATSRTAAMWHAGLLLGLVLAAQQLVSLIPLPALAGVLLATAAHMIKPTELWHLARSSKADAAVLVATLVLTVATDLITALVVGVLLWGLLRRFKESSTLPPVNQDETLGD